MNLPWSISCQKLGKINFFNTFQIKFWIEKSCHQNQDVPKAGKINFLILFLIEFWKEKSHHQNQDRAKSRKNQFLKTFLYWNFLKKIIWKWNLCRGTIKMLNTHQIVYIYIRNRTVRTPPHHQRFFQNQWTFYKNSIYKYMCPNRIYIYTKPYS